MSANKRFGSLLSAPPKPLPDDDEVSSEEAPEIEVVAEPETEPELVVLPPDEPKAEAQPRAAVETAQPEPAPATAPATAATAEVAEEPKAEPTKDELPVMNVPLTLRLHMPAARAFRDAWFDARRTKDPTLSSPSFASEIVMLGLAEYNKKLQR